MLHVVKRDGREVNFNAEKIAIAIRKSAKELGYEIKESELLDTVKRVISYIEETESEKVSVE